MTMSKVVAIAGGSGSTFSQSSCLILNNLSLTASDVAQEVIDAILARGVYHVVVLSRKVPINESIQPIRVSRR